MPKRDPLPENPLQVEETTLRSMVRNESPLAGTRTATPAADDRALNRTGVYLTDQECEALRVRAFEDRRTKTDIIRSALRQYLGLS